MPTPSISVVIPVWDDYCRLVESSVVSALEQDGVDVEVVVVDNASTVALPALPEAVRVLRAPQRLSAGAARNLALASMQAPLVMFLDADDTLRPGALARLAGMLAGRPDAVLAVGKRVVWDVTSGREYINPRSPHPLVYRVCRSRRAFALLTLRYDVFQLTGCAVARTAAVRDAGGFGDASLAEDWVLRSSLAARGRVLFTTEGVVRFRLADGSLWHRDHSHAELTAMYAGFRAHRRRDPRVPRWARALMPVLAAAHRRDARKLTRSGSFTPSPTLSPLAAEGASHA